MNRHEVEILGKVVAQQTGDGPKAARIERQREVVLARFEEIRTARLRRRTYLRTAFAAVVLMAVFGGIGMWYMHAAKKAYESSRKNALQEQVLRLPGGNEARLAEGSHGAILEASEKEVHLQLTSGSMTSFVRKPMRWCVEAGPYFVEAAGTEYTVHWRDPRLEVEVAQGAVTVSRAKGGPHLWVVKAKERLVIPDGHQPLAAPGVLQDVNPSKAPSSAEPPSAAPPDVVEETPPPQPLSPSAAPPDLHGKALPSSTVEKNLKPQPSSLPVSTPAQLPAWKQALQREDYRAAVEELEKTGVATFADTAGLLDLQAMAAAARYAGRPKTALVLLVSLRTRFPGTTPATVAAFLMGRVYAEQLGDHRAAVSWFSTYLAELPNGPLAEEALGRRMDSAHRCGMQVQARESAEELLKRFPSGPFAPLARKILEK